MVQPGKRFRVGMVGLGYFGQFHANAWGRIAETDLVAVCEKLPKLERKSAIGDEILHYQDVEEMLKEANLDILDIASPPTTHRSMIEKAVGKVPTIICQKPFCQSLAEAEEVVRFARESGTNLIVHENFRFQPWYRVVAERIARGAIGTIRQAHFRFRPGDGAGEDAYLARQPYFREMERFLIHETGIHFIDVFRFLFGEPIALNADLWTSNPFIAGEDSGIVVLEFEDGLRAIFDANRTLDHSSENPRLTMGEMLIEGEEGTLTVNGYGEVSIRVKGASDAQSIECPFDDTDFGGDCVYHFQNHVISHLLGKGDLENRGEDYLRNIQIENRIYEAAERGCRLSLKSTG